MLELGRKEHHLFGGIFVLIGMVALLVFPYTQAVRQLNRSREMFYRLQEQLAVARDQMARRPATSDLSALQAEVEKLKEKFAAESELDSHLSRIEQTAREEFNLQGLQARRTDLPVDTLAFPVEGRPDFEVQLYGLELAGSGTSPAAAGLLATMAEPGGHPILSLAALELRAAEPELNQPVQLTVRWLVPVPKGVSWLEDVPAARPPVRPEWGSREEPFFSPLEHSNALRLPAEKQGSFQLSGILWDPAKPSCVINQRVLKPGEWIDSYQVILITPTAAVLQGLDEELVLTLS